MPQFIYPDTAAYKTLLESEHIMMEERKKVQTPEMRVRRILFQTADDLPPTAQELNEQQYRQMGAFENSLD